MNARGPGPDPLSARTAAAAMNAAPRGFVRADEAGAGGSMTVRHAHARLLAAAAAAALLGACTPKVQVVPPDEPITINLNVKIDHEVRVKVDRELEEAYRENPDLF